ncbi:hypothetical protein ACNHKD_15115 [Methylocystis sp. JAN1]|uniref:hypothetical protein n=1 Tax=Methylocystis sp. JAN1 TaxID=3397211 RepID=UPI003FA1FA80
MLNILLRVAGLAAALSAAAPASAGSQPFSCRLRKTVAPLPELDTFSGYRWIECRVVGMEVAEVAGVAVNKGNCQSFDYWYAGRTFVAGETINIPYACISPVSVAIQANGVIATMRLR